jgi:phosphoglucosamine mutase
MHPRHLQEAVVSHRADLGLALDGDSDRLLMVDGEGRAYDGDQLLYIIALDYWRRGAMAGGVVGTQMSNLGFEPALAKRGIPLERAPVGDRYVLEKMIEKQWILGGENSGHIICLDKHTTGDAIVAALAVLRALREQELTFAQATADAPLFPQRLINVPIRRGFDWRASEAIRRAERAAVDKLDGGGRVLLRPSGTEPVLRVMVEAREAAAADTLAHDLADVVAKAAA